MARRRYFEFLIYRMNMTDEDALQLDLAPVRSNDDLRRIIVGMADSEHDVMQTARRSARFWSVRTPINYTRHADVDNEVVSVLLARSTAQSIDKFVTDYGIFEGEIDISPPSADDAIVFFYLRRHLVIIERNTSIVGSLTWKWNLQKIFNKSSRKLGFSTNLRLEPVLDQSDLLAIMRSFEVLREVRVDLTLPNPDITSEMADLIKMLKDGGIRYYLQHMRNPKGLSKADNHLPAVSLKVAISGYKTGEVAFFGARNGSEVKIITGRNPIRAQLSMIRGYLRQLFASEPSMEQAEALDLMIEKTDALVGGPTARREG